MHNHDKDEGSRGMLWMIIPCLLLIGVLFLGGGKLSGGGYLWPILMGVFVAAHIWMMLRGHGGHRGTNTEDKTDDASKKQPGAKDKH